MHIHILGIAGTAMGGIAIIAKQLGHKITGMDNNIYPPMSTQLIEQNIEFISEYSATNLPNADLYIIGNVLSRGNECVEYILDNNLNYTSGAAWLGENILKNKWVLAVSGTHGKTTTASILTWILEDAGLNPGFLIGGIANNFGISSRFTDSMFFVIEADEYDTAFFDKRSKFIHYYPNTLIIGNLEFDHADIFSDLDAIKTQFHNLIRTMPSSAQVIHPKNKNIANLLKQGLWSEEKIFNLPNWETNKNGTSFKMEKQQVNWQLIGEHNISNAVAAIYASNHAGIPFVNSCESLSKFKGIKRRLELKYSNENLYIYDDFAHHPTAIKTTIDGLRKKVGNEKIIIVLEIKSNTMKMGFFNDKLEYSLHNADQVLTLNSNIVANNISNYDDINLMLGVLKSKTGHIIFMSNCNFDNIINKLIKKL